MHKLGNSNTFAAVRANVSICDCNNFGKDSVFNLRGTEDQISSAILNVQELTSMGAME